MRLWVIDTQLLPDENSVFEAPGEHATRGSA